MTKTEQLQELHLRAASGETLTKEEEAALSSWYELLDREEAVINSQNQSTNMESLREKFDKTTAQISLISGDVAQLLKQNEILRQENMVLRRQLNPPRGVSGVSIGDAIKLTVRRRANFACEYCGVTEESTGGELTVDHYRPQSKNGGDELDNLVYCCVRCNLYKGDFWIESSDAPQIWNPRREPFEKYFWQADNGRLFALTETGELTLRVLRLNRPQLVAYRQHQFLQIEERRLLEARESAMEIVLRLNEEQRELLRAQKVLLDEQRRLLNLLLDNTDS